MTAFQFLQVFVASILNAVAQVSLKKAEIGSFSWDVVLNKFVWAGAGLFFLAFLLWVKVLNEIEISVAVPLMVGIMYVFVFLASWYLFREQITVLKVFGIFLIYLGIIFLVKK